MYVALTWLILIVSINYIHIRIDMFSYIWTTGNIMLKLIPTNRARSDNQRNASIFLLLIWKFCTKTFWKYAFKNDSNGVYRLIP